MQQIIYLFHNGALLIESAGKDKIYVVVYVYI